MNGKAPVTQDEDDAPLNRNVAPLFPHATGPAGMGMYPGMQMPGMQMPGMMPNMTGMPPMPQMMPNMQGMNGMQGMGMNMNMGMQDPTMLAAHQHAMLIAKQTYQWAVAQQAMAAAADEWERTGGSVAGWNPSSAASAYGGGAESVVGFPSSASVAGFPTGGGGRAPSMFMGQGMGGMGMGGMGGGMGMNPIMMNGGGPWGYMGSAQSMYAGSTYAPSEVGGVGPSQRPGFSSSRSEYGGGERSSRAFGGGNGRPPPVPSMPAGMQGQGQRGGVRQRTLTAPGGQAAPGPGVGKAKKSAPTLLGNVAPPSSWKGPG